MGIERTVLPDRSLNAGNGIFVQLPGPRRALLLDAQFVQGGRLAIGRCHSGTALKLGILAPASGANLAQDWLGSFAPCRIAD